MINVNQTSIFDRYLAIRKTTQELIKTLTSEDMVVQSMPDVSPTKWHLAHTTWFWETFLLSPNLREYQLFDHDFNYLFNSYYEQVGSRHARPERGMLTRPSLDCVLKYRLHVDGAMARLLDDQFILRNPSVLELVELGFAHEQQHQELLLTDIKHVLSRNPCSPAAMPPSDPIETKRSSPAVQWIEFAGGVHEFGHGTDDFCFDNEGPRHRAVLTPYALADRPVTNAEFLEFILDDGYRNALLWLSEGWAIVNEQNWQAPLYWRQHEERWHEYTLHGEHPVEPDAPVTHLSYFEAAAYAEWTGRRLPEEREWEHAANLAAGADGRFAQAGRSAHPAPSTPGEGLRQMFGGVWEWTRSSYAPYPGFRVGDGAVGEYNGKFMCNQYVLRGGSCATPPDHIRATYRNFLPAEARWQFSGMRLARDL
jgi:ergothioneine biosynthesis protein EgtB